MWILDIFLQGDPRRVSSPVGEKFFMSEAYNNMLIRDSGATSLSLSLLNNKFTFKIGMCQKGADTDARENNWGSCITSD